MYHGDLSGLRQNGRLRLRNIRHDDEPRHKEHGTPVVTGPVPVRALQRLVEPDGPPGCVLRVVVAAGPFVLNLLLIDLLRTEQQVCGVWVPGRVENERPRCPGAIVRPRRAFPRRFAQQSIVLL